MSDDQLRDAVVARIAAAGLPPGLTLPAIADSYDFIPLSAETIAHVHERVGIQISSTGDHNILAVHRDTARLRYEPRVELSGGGNIVVIDEGSAFRGRVIMGSDNLCVLMGGQHALHLDVLMYAGGTLFWGRKSRTYGCRIWVEGGKRLIVGDDCLFSEGISLRTSDHHSIIDLATEEQMNAPKDLIIGEHVWIGPDCTLLAGVEIGACAIIGVGSIVTRSVGAAELWAGVPAARLRENVSWVDSHPASPMEIAELRTTVARVTTSLFGSD